MFASNYGSHYRQQHSLNHLGDDMKNTKDRQQPTLQNITGDIIHTNQP
jgi:hypothetical protein